MYRFPVGVANSVSSNFQFDPIDTIEFAKNRNFEIIQIYLNQDILKQPKVLRKIQAAQESFKTIYFHAEGFLNEEFANSEYRLRLFDFLKETESPNYILHFDESASIDKLIQLVDQLAKFSGRLLLENYFQAEGKEAAEKNLKKYMALFTLSSNFGHHLYPVIDIPRLFHQKLAFTEAESLEWSYQIFNFFGNNRIPILLHVIDAKDDAQARASFTALGNGYLPYQQLFEFLFKTRPNLEGLIMEFEDKMNPISSIDFLESFPGFK